MHLTWHWCTNGSSSRHLSLNHLYCNPTATTCKPLSYSPLCHRCRDKGYTTVLRNYEDNWQECAENWAAYGRAACWAMGIDTNNHLERWFGLLKITILRRKRLSQLALLVSVLVEEVMVPTLQTTRLAKPAQMERSVNSTRLVGDRGSTNKPS